MFRLRDNLHVNMILLKTGGYHMLNDSKTDTMLLFRIETVHGKSGTIALMEFRR